MPNMQNERLRTRAKSDLTEAKFNYVKQLSSKDDILTFYLANKNYDINILSLNKWDS